MILGNMHRVVYPTKSFADPSSCLTICSTQREPRRIIEINDCLILLRLFANKTVMDISLQTAHIIIIFNNLLCVATNVN